jgi:hypothetical protein
MVPFTSLERPEELEMKSKEQHDPGERAAPTPLVASFKAGSGAKIKSLMGQRNPLITLDSAKKMQGFLWLYFCRALLDEVRIWPHLDSAWAGAPAFCPVPRS